jgi:hypothetical protein
MMTNEGIQDRVLEITTKAAEKAGVSVTVRTPADSDEAARV